MIVYTASFLLLMLQCARAGDAGLIRAVSGANRERKCVYDYYYVVFLYNICVHAHYTVQQALRLLGISSLGHLQQLREDLARSLL